MTSEDLVIIKEAQSAVGYLTIEGIQEVLKERGCREEMIKSRAKGIFERATKPDDAEFFG